MLSPTRGGPRSTSEWDTVLNSLGIPAASATGGRDDLDWSMAAMLPKAKKPKEDEGRSVLGFLGNVAGDVKDVATGFFPSIWQINKTLGQGVYGGTIGLIPGTGGGLARRSFANNASEIGGAALATLKQSGSNWKRVATGDFEPLYEDGALMGLDVAAVASLGAGAAVRGARLTRAAGNKKIAKVARDTRVVKGARRAGGARVNLRDVLDDIADPKLERQLARGEGVANNRAVNWLADSTTLARRQRPDKVLQRDVALRSLEDLGLDALQLEKLGDDMGAQASVPQRKLARTFLARGIQRPLIAGIDAMVGKSDWLTARSNNRSARRLVGQADRNARERSAQMLVDAGVNDYDRAINDKDFRKNAQEQVAAMLHLEGVLGDREGLSAVAARDLAVQEARDSLEAAKREFPGEVPKDYKDAEAQIQILESLPEELLNLKGDSPSVKRVQRVVSSGSNFGRNLREYDLYDLDEVVGKDVRRERESLTQRILVGGAKYMPDFGRAMVPEEVDRLVRGGQRYASASDVGKVVGRIRGKVNDQTATPGEAAYRFVDRTDQREAFRAATPAQRLRTLQQVERGEVTDREGKRPTAEERYSASAELRELQKRTRKPRNVPSTTDTVSAYRVRSADGSTSAWVRGQKGSAPAPVRRAKGKGDTIEYAEVPASTWYRNQNNEGRVESLPGRLDRETVRLKDGREVGVLRGEAGTGATRRRIPETNPDEPLNRPLPPKAAKQLRESDLSPAAQRTVVEELGYDRPKGKATNAQVVAQALVESGHLKIDDLTGVTRREHLDKAIARGVSSLQRGKLPLDSAGRVDFDRLWTQLRTDDALREAWSAPKLLSRTEIKPSVYVKHRTLGDVSHHTLLNRRGRESTSPVGPEASVTRTEGILAGRLGYSLSPQSLIRTAESITRTVSNREFLGSALDTWAVKDKNGRVLTYAAENARHLGKEWMAIPVKAFDRAEVWLRDWDPEKKDNPGNVVYKADELTGKEGEVYLFPAEIGQQFKYAFNNPMGFWKKYDTIMQMWRGGILALAPRWYINNFIGNTIFYGFATGMDLAAIRLARTIHDKIPYRVHSGGMSSQGRDDSDLSLLSEPQGKSRFTRRYFRIIEGGYRLNNVFEGGVRDAAYVHAMKKLLTNEGLYSKKARSERAKGKANDLELMEAIANAPDYIKREAIREMESWMGDYQNLGKIERDVVRRAMPFYSWLKVINTWMFGLPFRSPLRAELLVMASALGNELAGDRSYLPWWEQGRIDLTKGMSLRTSGMNPFGSVVEPLLALGQKGAGWQDVGTEVLASFGGQTSPIIQGVIGWQTGRKMFGDRDFTAPTGYGGAVNAYGKDPATLNTISGQIETRSNKGSLVEGVLQMVPVTQQIRDLVSGGRTPYDSSSTLELVLGAMGVKQGEELYQPPAKSKSGRQKIPLAGYAGLPVYRVDRAKEKADFDKRMRQFRKDKILQKRLIRREAARRESG